MAAAVIPSSLAGFYLEEEEEEEYPSLAKGFPGLKGNDLGLKSLAAPATNIWIGPGVSLYLLHEDAGHP